MSSSPFSLYSGPGAAPAKGFPRLFLTALGPIGSHRFDVALLATPRLPPHGGQQSSSKTTKGLTIVLSATLLVHRLSPYYASRATPC